VNGLIDHLGATRLVELSVHLGAQGFFDDGG